MAKYNVNESQGWPQNRPYEYKSFTEEEKVTLENYQAAFKCMKKLNQEMQHNIEIKLET